MRTVWWDSSQQPFAVMQISPDVKNVVKYLNRLRKEIGEECSFICGYEAGCNGDSTEKFTLDKGALHSSSYQQLLIIVVITEKELSPKTTKAAEKAWYHAFSAACLSLKQRGGIGEIASTRGLKTARLFGAGKNAKSTAKKQRRSKEEGNDGLKRKHD